MMTVSNGNDEILGAPWLTIRIAAVRMDTAQSFVAAAPVAEGCPGFVSFLRPSAPRVGPPIRAHNAAESDAELM